MEDLKQIPESVFTISEIIVRKLSEKDLSGEDEKQLDDWLSASARNRSLYNHIKDKRNFEERNELIRQIDTGKAWLRYKQKVNVNIDRKPHVQWWRYAAAVLIPIAVVLYIVNPGKKTAQNYVKEEQILPGSKNAVLVLGSGKSINLEEGDSLDIKEEDGTRIIKDNDLLSYHKPENEACRKIPTNTLIIPQGGEYNLILSDSSKVYLNSMSKLVFPVSFSKKNREVFLEGEACFIVRKDPDHPFIVNVNGIQVEVLGTTFNINAYGDQEKVMTTLVEGKVKIRLTDSPGSEFILKPNDQAVYELAGEKIQINQVDAASYMQWINGIYTFNDQSLGEIMRTLSRWYDFNYWFEQQDLKHITFKGGLNKYESIEPILDIIKSTGKVDVTISGKNILFNKK